MPLLTIDDLLHGNPAETSNLIGRASGLSSMFDEYLRKSSRGEEGRSGGIHASEISSCERRTVYSLMGTPRSGEGTDTTWRKRFMMGQAVHEMLQAEFHKFSLKSNHVITFQEEVTILPELQALAAKWDIHSSCDGKFVIRESWDGPAIISCLVEIKTMSPTEFKDLKEPKPEHIEQAHIYMACLNVPMIWLLYWNKGNQNTTGTDNPNFLVKFNPKKWEELEERMDRCHKNAALEILPERTEGIYCEFCAFSAVCQPACKNKGSSHTTAVPRWMR